jgi:hypothetical protein
MNDYNSKVDLRPQSMIPSDSSRIGRPPVDCVLQPEQREFGIPRAIPNLSQQLQNVVLKKTEQRQQINAEGSRSINDLESVHFVTPHSSINVPQPSWFKPTEAVDIGKEDMAGDMTRNHLIPPPPPPPPFPLPQQTRTHPKPIVRHTKSHGNDDLIAKTERIERELATLREAEKRHLEEISKGKEELRQYERLYVHTPEARDEAERDRKPLTPPMSPQEHRVFDTDQVSRNRNFSNWIQELVDDKFERASRAERDEETTPLKSEEKVKTSTRGRSRDGKERHTSRSRSRSSTKSKATIVSNAQSTRSVRSIAKSVKSVLFRGTQEVELRSEIDDEDIADREAGDIGFIDYTSERFTIHGPFMDKELNVFHAICKEYELAAKMTFAKRNPFSRTNPAHERIYALIGSDKRSKWVNRNDWSQATNLPILDYIFRKVVRSKTRMILKPVMELDHFKEKAELTPYRFYRIMRSIFNKRDHLMEALGIRFTQIEDMK